MADSNNYVGEHGDEIDKKWVFDSKLVYESFKKCAEDKEGLLLESYLIAFRELYRFFLALGSVFGFIASDVISKITILEDLMKSDSSTNYCTVQSMLKYEKDSALLNKPGFVSGSRTLLRLHRALEFISHFMNDLAFTEPTGKASIIAQDCYKRTLAKFHPWLIQKGAILAMYTLPTCKTFIEQVAGNKTDTSEEMIKIAEVADLVYDITQNCYKEHDLLDLP